MTEEELKAEAKKLGYVVMKKPCYQCTCYKPYPNESHKRKNGKWKCVDNFRPVKFNDKWLSRPTTYCARINGEEQG